MQQNKVVAAQLEEQEKAPFLTVDNAQTAVALTIQVLLGFGFLFLAFFASDNLLEEKRHFSLIHSYPQVFPIRMISKVGVKMIGHLATISLLLLGITAAMSVIGRWGIGTIQRLSIIIILGMPYLSGNTFYWYSCF
ncbi:hypothetical protein ODV97_02050 [Enterococcus gallinarum]|nr:hypothetical protein [Enterococcus gallinarum]